MARHTTRISWTLFTLCLTGLPAHATTPTEAIIQLEATAIAGQEAVWAAGAAIDQTYREVVIQQSLQPAPKLTATQVMKATEAQKFKSSLWQLLGTKSKPKNTSPLAVAQQEYQTALAAYQTAHAALEPIDANLDAQLTVRLETVLQDPTLADGNMIPLLEQHCFQLGIATRRALPFGVRNVIAGLTAQYSEDVIAAQTLTKYCLSAVHGELKPAAAHLSDWIEASLYLNTAQALALDAALADALSSTVQALNALPLPETRRALGDSNFSP